MKTRMFVAEILCLFLGLRPLPQSQEQAVESSQQLHDRILGEQENLFKRWHSSSLIRPPPRGDRTHVKTT